MTPEEIQKYDIKAFQEGGRYFLGAGGRLGEFDANTLLQSGFDPNQASAVPWDSFGGASFEKYSDINKFINPLRQREANQLAMQQQEEQARLGNEAIKSGNVAEVERLNPGYTLWNGAFVEKSKIPELQAQGATVKDGNVVGPNVPGLGGQPMSPEQQAATSPQAQQQAVQQAGQPQNPQNQTNAVQYDQNGQPIDATLGANPTQVGGRFGTQQFGRVGNDVYEIMSDGSRRKVTEAEFNQKLRAQGLNLDVLPQLDLNDNVGDTPGGTPNPDINPDGTPKGPGDFLSDYKNIIKELGLSDIKAEFEKTKQEYIDLQDKKNAEIADINSNPWLSEGIRQAEVKKINTKYELKENTISNQQKLYESMYEEGIAQAKFITSGLQEDRNKMLDLALKREEAERELRELGFDQELDLLKLDLEERKLRLDQYKASQEGVSGTDPANLLAYAQQYASTGKIPTGMPKGTFGLISQLAASLPKPSGTLIDLNTGVKPDIGDAKVDGYSALYDLTKKLTEAKSLFEEAGTGVGFGLLSKVRPTSDQQKYNNLRTEITDLLARARTGAALTREEEEFYRNRMPGLFSESLFLGASGEQKLIDLQKQITDTLKTKLAAQGLDIIGLGEDPAAQFDQ